MQTILKYVVFVQGQASARSRICSQSGDASSIVCSFLVSSETPKLQLRMWPPLVNRYSEQWYQTWVVS